MREIFEKPVPSELCHFFQSAGLLEEVACAGNSLCGYITSSAHFELHVDHMLLDHKAADHDEAHRMALKHFQVADK